MLSTKIPIIDIYNSLRVRNAVISIKAVSVYLLFKKNSFFFPLLADGVRSAGRIIYIWIRRVIQSSAETSFISFYFGSFIRHLEFGTGKRMLFTNIHTKIAFT